MPKITNYTAPEIISDELNKFDFDQKMKNDIMTLYKRCYNTNKKRVVNNKNQYQKRKKNT